MGSSTNNKRVVIAIDFGTSRSGCAYAFTTEPKIIGITEWAGQPVPYCKTPTHILYNPDRSIEAWGWEAKTKLAEIQSIFFNGNDYHFFQNFKMKLRRGHGTAQNSPSISTPDGQVFAVIDLITDYLAELKKLALDTVGNSMSGYLKDDEILWCLTIPAIWTDAEKQLMRQAAQKAELVGEGSTEAERLLLVLEPEAAAIYCMEKEKSQFEPGCRFMVVDCGGGTVDITVHEVLQSRQLQEVVDGSGEAYGSTYIDDEFEKFLRKKLNYEVIEKYKENELLEYREMMGSWERIKCNFDPQVNNHIIYFGIPGRLHRFLRNEYPQLLRQLEEEQAGEDAYIFLDKSTMLDIFVPTINGLIQTVESQFQKLGHQSCDFLFLVGGFSSSPLLQQRIREKFGGRVKKIVIPPNPGAAIVEGAVSYGLNPAIIPLRRSRFTYGCGTAKPFDPTQDPEGKKFQSSYHNGADYCKQRFDIFVNAGDPVEAGKSISRIFEPQHRDQEKIEFIFYSTEKQAVRYTDEDDVNQIGTLSIDLLQSDTTKRKVVVTMYFGDTEIKVEATDQETGTRQKIELVFSATSLHE